MSKRRVVFHIGTPKTGTTYVQHCLLINRERLAHGRVLAPLSGSQKVGSETHGNLNSYLNHHLLAWKYQERRKATFDQSRREKIDNFEMEFDREFSAREFDVALFSSECLYWELRHSDRIKALRETFQQFDVSIIIFLRNPLSLLDSFFAHSVFDHQFNGSIEDCLQINLNVIDYTRGLKPWFDIFGQVNVKVIQYPIVNDTNIFLTVLNSFGYEYDEEHLLLPRGLSNVTASPIFTYMINELQRANQITLTERRAILNIAKTVRTSDISARLATDAVIDRLESIYAKPVAQAIPQKMVLEWLDGFAEARKRRPVGELRLGQIAGLVGRLCQEILVRMRAREQAAVAAGKAEITALVQSKLALEERVSQLELEIHNRDKAFNIVDEELRAKR